MRRLRRRPPGSAGRRDTDPPPPGQGERAHSPLIGNAVFSSETRGRHQMWESPKGRGTPRCQAHTSDSRRGGPAGRGLSAQAQSGLATGHSPAGGACGGGRDAEGPGRSLSSEPPTLSEPDLPPCGSWTLELRQPRWLRCRPRARVPKRLFLKPRPVCCHFLAQDPPRPCRALKALQGLRGIHAPAHLPAWPWEGAQPPQNAPCCVPGPQKPALPSFPQVSAQMSPETPLAPPLPCCVDVSSVGAGNGPVSLRVPYRAQRWDAFLNERFPDAGRTMCAGQ